MNWGYKILFVYGAFGSGHTVHGVQIIITAFRPGNNRLLHKRTEYQDKIDGDETHIGIIHPVSCELKDRNLEIVFSQGLLREAIGRRAALLCPSDGTTDLKKNSTYRMKPLQVPVTGMKPGMYELPELEGRSCELLFRRYSFKPVGHDPVGIGSIDNGRMAAFTAWVCAGRWLCRCR